MPIRLPIKNTNQFYEINPSKIIALGLNYRDHAKESASMKIRGVTTEALHEPVLFAKTPNVLIGPGESIVIPRFLKQYQFTENRIDYEGELAIIIKKNGKNIHKEDAFEYIYGYTCMNDVTQRNIQNSDISGWFRGKSLDTFGPIGPGIVESKDIKDPQNLKIETRLNGKTVQSSNTADMIFTIPEIIAFISAHFTLYPGDIIMTGTPSGVGSLHHRDIVEIEIENIGTLLNPVIEE